MITLRLDINYKERLQKKKNKTQTYGGSIMLLNNQWITEAVKEKIKKKKKKYLETNENKNSMTQNPREAVKIVPR